MAQVALATAPIATNGASLTAEDLREILEYERLVQFKDSVLAGTHPRVKIAPHLLAKYTNATRNTSSPNLPTPPRNTTAAALPPRPPHLESASSYYNSSPSNQRGVNGSHIPMSSKSEINPILLEKSDDLIRAEIQLQRQRIERTLREQIEQQRIAAKALLQTSESLPNFDISEVLSKALAIVHPTVMVDPETPAAVSAHPSTASDSFDENTFYSSQHDTPEGSTSSRSQRELAALSDGEIATDTPAKAQVKDRDVVMAGTSLSKDNDLAGQAHSQAQHLPWQSNKSIPDQPTTANSYDSGNNLPAVSTPSSGDNASLHKKNDNVQSRQALETIIAQPNIVRAHNLSPFAPQPARVSPLVTARENPITRDNASSIQEAQPAQVSALRTQPGASSTDSSPKGTSAVEKKREKKNKKNKRKGKELADAPDSPYIKPEPRSPSPYNAAPLPRPQKRQRQSTNFAAQLDYEEPRINRDIEIIETRAIPEPYSEVRPARSYERVEERYEPEIRRPEPIYRRVERDDDQYRRVNEVRYATRPESPAVFAVPYPPGEGRAVRAVSHAIVDSRPLEEPRYYREPVIRASVRPDADRERSRSPIRERRSPMGPPRQAMRLMMDEYGRKYYEAVPASSMRQSVAPPIRYRDPEVIYERAPVRSVSSRIPADTYEEDGVLYRRASPAISAPRRVVTQPEYALPAQPDYRSYREREYSVRPTAMAPPGAEYIQIRGPTQQRQISVFEEPPREYIQRAPSVRPEAVRYEIPREYVGRAPSVRPELQPREYASSVRPEALPREYTSSVRPEPLPREYAPSGRSEAPLREYPASVRTEGPPREYASSVLPEGIRREVISRPQREYSVRPEVLPRREHIVIADDDRYYEEAPIRRPAEVTYRERPRAREASVVVYADDGRREYR